MHRSHVVAFFVCMSRVLCMLHRPLSSHVISVLSWVFLMHRSHVVAFYRLHVSCSVHVASLFVMHRSHVVVPCCLLCIALMLLPSVCISPGVRSCMSHTCSCARASTSAVDEGLIAKMVRRMCAPRFFLSLGASVRCTLCRYAVYVLTHVVLWLHVVPACLYLCHMYVVACNSQYACMYQICRYICCQAHACSLALRM